MWITKRIKVFSFNVVRLQRLSLKNVYLIYIRQIKKKLSEWLMNGDIIFLNSLYLFSYLLEQWMKNTLTHFQTFQTLKFEVIGWVSDLVFFYQIRIQGSVPRTKEDFKNSIGMNILDNLFCLFLFYWCQTFSVGHGSGPNFTGSELVFWI